MNCIYESIERFLTTLEQTSESMGQFQKDVSNREQKILDEIGALAETLRYPVSDQKCKDDPLFKEIVLYFSEIGRSVELWRKRVQKVMKDREFIDRFDKSLIVMVYGKVKAGKSTLGNFVSGVMLKDLADSPYKAWSPEFLKHESADKATQVQRLQEIEESGFEVKPTEATNCIQTFTLGGLAWVDTPGIHSMTDANGELATRYVENAELVIYLSSSDSPIRQSDLDELVDLMRQQKPTLIVISKFDEFEEDEDEETGNLVRRLVSKSEQSKREQLEWIESQVLQGGLNNLLQNREHAFVSVRLAHEALREGDVDKFSASGMPAFYQQITSILSEDAVRLKQQAPKKKINVLIKELCEGFENRNVTSTDDSVRKWIHTYSQLADDIISRKKALLKKSSAFSQTAIARCDIGITDILQRAEQQLVEGNTEVDISEEISEYLSRQILEVVRDELREEMRQSEHSLRETIGSIQIDRWSLPPLEQRWESISVSNNHLTEGIGSSIGGVGGGAAGTKVGAVIGTIVGGPGIGTVVGGIVGGAIGFLSGNFLGRGVGNLVAGRKSIKVQAGTNLDALRSTVFKNLNKMAPAVTEQILITFADHWYDPMLEQTNHLLGRLRHLEENLHKLVFAKKEGLC